MKAYVLVEGERTEKALYRAWLALCFPGIAEVPTPEALGEAEHAFYILAGLGYPSYLRRLRAAVLDIEKIRSIDWLMVCVDAEERTYDDTRDEIIDIATDARLHAAQLAVVVQDCCLETWLLGNRRIVNQTPTDDELLELVGHYDVSVNDPEQLPRLDLDTTRAQTHFRYLRAVFRERNATYSKQRPGGARAPSYFREMVARVHDTDHLQSFARFLEQLRIMGATTF